MRQDPVIFPALEEGRVTFAQANELLAAPAVARRTLLDRVLRQLLDGEDVGTVVAPQGERHGLRKRWMLDLKARGELRVVLLNTDSTEPFVVEPGMRIAQLVVLAVPEVELVEVDELPGSERGVRGFGSSAT